jgi:hypothetical protein
MRPAWFLALTSAVVLAAGCDSGADAGLGPLPVDGTVTSVSPGSTAPLLVALQWVDADELGDDAATAVAVPVPAALPAKFSFNAEPPRHYYADFDLIRTLPPCGGMSGSFEIVPAEPFKLESLEALRTQPELCLNWS